MTHQTMNFVGAILVAVLGFGAGAMLCLGLVAELRSADRRATEAAR